MDGERFKKLVLTKGAEVPGWDLECHCLLSTDVQKDVVAEAQRG